MLQQSLGLIEAAVDAMRNTARPGVKESEVYGAMIGAMIAGGAEIPTMLSWLSGPWGHLSRRLTIATERALQSGDTIMNAIEARYAGYTGQHDPPLFLGPVPPNAQDTVKWQTVAADPDMAVCT